MSTATTSEAEPASDRQRLLVIQHDHVSPLGPIAERFAEHGYDAEELLVVPEDRFENPGVAVDLPDPTAYDAVVTMGAKWSTYDLDLVGSWVLPEIDLLRAADAAGVPVLGICFGGQLLATAHGGSVERSDRPELGWVEVETDRPELVASGPWFQWHLDRWTTPGAATEIARNPAAPQAFVLRRNLAVQFHPELTPSMLHGWLANGGEAAVEALGVDLESLLLRTEQEADAARQRARALVDAFLAEVVG